MSLTVGGRLKALSGLAGATVGQMLQAIGSGATMAQCLVSYSGLASGTVAEHLLVDAVTPEPTFPPVDSGGALAIRPPRRKPRRRLIDETEALLLLGVI